MKKLLSIGLISINIIVTIFAIASLNFNGKGTLFKFLDFPRIQMIILSIILIVFTLFLSNQYKTFKYFSLFGILITLVINTIFVYKYSPLAPVEISSAKVNKEDSTISILNFNVLMDNKDYNHVLDIVADYTPDIILLTEPNKEWTEGLKSLENLYPYNKLQPKENTYGMLLYSKFPLENFKLEQVSNEGVPTMHTEIKVSNEKIHFFGIHPVPPKDFKNKPDNEGEEENMLMKLGRKINEIPIQEHIIIAGDFNDVLWGRINSFTNTGDRLKDPRVGRLPYNTFNANKFYMSWPLDHVIVSKDFELVDFKKLKSGGSDHNPILVELKLQK